MESKREATKNKLKEKILKTAIKVFFENGYERTTINQIAKAADVGTGTAYNYFDSKADLFIQAMESLVTDQKYSVIYNIENIDNDPIKELTQLTHKFFDYIVNIDIELIKELFGVIFGTLVKNNNYAKRFYQMDEHYIKQVKQLLNHYIDIGKLPIDFDIDSCTTLIYFSVVLNMLDYLYIEETDVNEVRLFIEKQFKFILEDKLIG
ncbi:MAG: TetR/AcrR family transcriptional regulator [Clostridia bacterium]|nr:TetR/AcrR family transcriptional regulator [Clostridia bacterium]